ncbi:unnamed protein product [Arabidopsis arenosa]|uniref:Oleosin n=1 Tax=Arabidopsis arenosa TaxID=38785 RepID=A0A8S2B6N9_ARAAE|nr:unnamed protein product [Arabidopsis arenosa]
MHFFGTKGKPPLYAGLAVVSLMILTGLTFAGTAVALTVMMPVLVVLCPILVPAVITSSFLATGFLASGSLGASGIAFLIWLYKKEEHSRDTLHARGGYGGGAKPNCPQVLRPKYFY